jgi:hypothetical protein
MDIQKLAKRPELVEVVLDDNSIIEEYGDIITFWMKDFVDINTYFDFFRSQSEKTGDELGILLAKLILNEQGEPVLKEGETFPIDITVAALTKINERLGKSKTKRLTPQDGTQPE